MDDVLDGVYGESFELCKKFIESKIEGGYERVVNAFAELFVALDLAKLDRESISGKMAHDLATARAFKNLRKAGISSKEAEIRSGFGSDVDNLSVRGLAPSEEVDLPVICVDSDATEHDEAKAYYVLMKWLSGDSKAFWEGRENGCHVKVTSRPSDPTVIQVGWYNDKGVLISHIDFDLRFRMRRYTI